MRRVLYPGCRLLFVAHIRLKPAVSSQQRTHVRQNSDDLIEDLERQLDGTLAEYLQVRVTYRHSRFPERGIPIVGTMSATASDGISSLQTIMQTTAVATIKRHNFTSPWSPPPCMPRSNSLFEIIASHWDAEIAHAVMQRVIRSRYSPPRASTLGLLPDGAQVQQFMSSRVAAKAGWGEEDGIRYRDQNNQDALHSAPKPPARACPRIPKRQTSLRRVTGSSLPLIFHLVHEATPRPELAAKS